MKLYEVRITNKNFKPGSGFTVFNIYHVLAKDMAGAITKSAGLVKEHEEISYVSLSSINYEKIIK